MLQCFRRRERSQSSSLSGAKRFPNRRACVSCLLASELCLHFRLTENEEVAAIIRSGLVRHLNPDVVTLSSVFEQRDPHSNIRDSGKNYRG
jgi:hypothetical protein